jgi:hypothetical protein
LQVTELLSHFGINSGGPENPKLVFILFFHGFFGWLLANFWVISSGAVPALAYKPGQARLFDSFQKPTEVFQSCEPYWHVAARAF